MNVVVGIFTLASAVILWFVFPFARGDRWLEWSVTPLTITAGGCFTATPFGRYVRGVISSLDTLIVPLVGAGNGPLIGTALVAVAGLLVVALLIAGLWQRGIELYTLLCAFIAPFLVVSVPGMVGDFLRGTLGMIGTAVSSVFHGLFSI